MQPKHTTHALPGAVQHTAALHTLQAPPHAECWLYSSRFRLGYALLPCLTIHNLEAPRDCLDASQMKSTCSNAMARYCSTRPARQEAQARLSPSAGRSHRVTSTTSCAAGIVDKEDQAIHHAVFWLASSMPRHSNALSRCSLCRPCQSCHARAACQFVHQACSSYPSAQRTR